MTSQPTPDGTTVIIRKDKPPRPEGRDVWFQFQADSYLAAALKNEHDAPVGLRIHVRDRPETIWVIGDPDAKDIYEYEDGDVLYVFLQHTFLVSPGRTSPPPKLPSLATTGRLPLQEEKVWVKPIWHLLFLIVFAIVFLLIGMWVVERVWHASF